MRETLTRVLRSYGFARGEDAAGRVSIEPAARTDCDFDPDAWDRGEQHTLSASAIGRVVLSRLPAMGRAWQTAALSGSPTLAPCASDDALPPWRAVIELPPDTSHSALAALHALGVRGVRFDLDAAAADDLDALLTIADRIVPFGWHVELRLRTGASRVLARHEWRLMQFPVAVCFSGLGSCGREHGSADFDFVLGLVQLGRYWLKLSGQAFAPPQLKLWDEPPPLARALLTTRKDRLIWGSGRRLVGEGAAQIDASLALLEKCLPHPGDQHRVLVDNPARLYGF